ncbi:hypothetical protein L1987_44882 [Smallanthus sonchifolius]|uniref:Uncharacterized protein n=1 Tax=Smallanthus sonchifolius TaxID=185202 RepID=A0ACB9GSU3_9ASTR|nr:hypothetical protein L1987_44882 [Smallanthus sonchifolius]
MIQNIPKMVCTDLGQQLWGADLMKQVELAWTETFVVKDERSKYYEKHPYPFLSDKILEQKASSKIWDDIVKNAQASNGLFLYIDPRKTGVVLDVRRQLKALIVEAQNLVKFASEHLKALDYFEDEISLKKHLQSDPGFTSLSDGPPRTSSRVADACLNNSNETPFVTSQSEQGKEKVPFDDQEYVSFHPPSPNGLNFWSAEAGTSSPAARPLLGIMNTSDISGHTLEESEFIHLLNAISPILYGSPNIECHSTASLCTIARTRWTKVSRLLRRNSVRERISLSRDSTT